ncbi:MAG: hypothetical protein GXO59_06805 [Dictyoglomi bacterium]|nr:hypothetical protein [Dictyoglomota bacterium]
MAMDVTPILVIGGSNIDIKGRSSVPPVLGNSNPGEVYITPGGVGRNITSTLATLGAVVSLITSFSTDEWGLTIRASLDKQDVDVYVVDKGYTGTYVGVLDNHGKTIIGVAGKNPAYEITWDDIKDFITDASIWVFDTNLSPELVEKIVMEAQERHVFSVLVPASPKKLEPVVHVVEKVNMAVLNKDEVELIRDMRPKDILIGTSHSSISIWHRGQITNVHFAPVHDYVDDTGAGDTFTAAVIYHHLLMGMDLVESVKVALDYARMSLESYSSDI